MPSAAITDPDERKATPAVIASDLGWARGSEFGWSWSKLLDQAERRYYENRTAAIGARRAS